MSSSFWVVRAVYRGLSRDRPWAQAARRARITR
jgi:hypothetical protein